MNYHEFLFGELLKKGNTKYTDLDYDTYFETIPILYKEFENSPYYEENKALFECIEAYLENVNYLIDIKYTLALKLQRTISWENWSLDAEAQKEKSKKLGRKLTQGERFFSITEVLNNKVNWIIEFISETDANSEHIDTLDELKIILQLVDVEKIIKEEE